MQVVFRELPVRCMPDKIPAAITVDVSALEIGTACSVKDLELPEGVEVLYGPDRRVVVVTEALKIMPDEAEVAAAAAAAAAAATPEGGAAPAAPAATPSR